MAASPSINEEVLHAFVDGETDAQTNAVILAYLSASPADAARVETWRSQNELIRASFAKIEHEPIPLSLSLAQSRDFRGEPLVQLLPAASNKSVGKEDISQPAAKTGDLARLCAAIAIAFAVGMIAALVTPHLTNPLVDLVTNRNPEETTKTAADLALPSRTLTIAALHESAPAREVDPSPVTPSPGLTRELTALDLSVKGFQIGATPQDPALCFFLETKAHELLTLCREPFSEKAGASTIPAFQTMEAHALRSVYWNEKTGRFALAGPLSEAAMLDLSHRIHASIEASNQKPD